VDPPPVRETCLYFVKTISLFYLIPVIPGMDNSYYTTTTHSQMEYAFPNNNNNTNVVYHRNRTGSNYFRVFYKNAAQIRFTPKEVGRVFGIAKFTPTVNEIREWCKEMVEKYETQPETQQVEGGGDETGEIEEKTKEPMVV
jgi:hypothetical protein